ncbi:glycoside hydrolase family 11 protein [Pleomassaria siparia CBS 279.74]|uniref:Endo-1,4-beta-xylanase n=1 Tax=Pleomassaria siparia CBS 279.74 TaxID=1314801 RepID=A0A6G1KLT5_9PLEO|nr:glycoside hydrolase family 11 protein [Pleomassaria siparia CBS 279.74]
MVAFTSFLVAAWAIVGSLAAPTAESIADAGPDFELRRTSLARRQDYTQDYETTGTVDFTSSDTGYSVTFSGAADFVVGKGWKTGTRRNITFSGSTTASAGTVLLSVYGWTTDPLVEYYVQEYYNTGSGAAQGTKVGTLESDGSTYDIWKHQQVDQPSIQGTNTFWQYISVRQSKRSDNGTVTVGNHFDAWANAGLTLGTQNYQTVSTEGFGTAAGNSKYTVS